MDAPKNKMTGPEKAAVLILALGKEGASPIIQNLRPQEVERLTMTMSNMKQVTPDATDEVVEEFYNMLRGQPYFYQQGGGGATPDLLSVAASRSAGLTGGMESTREILEAAMGADKADEIISNMSGFNLLKDIDAAQLLDFLRNEHPQTIALILAHLNREQAAEILSRLPEERQHDIVQRIATMDKISPEMIQSVEEALQAQFESVLRRDMSAPGGKRAAAEILNSAEGGTEKRVLNSLQKIDQELVREIQDMMFVFEDITTLSPMEIQKVLQQASTKDVALALIGSNDEIKSFLLGNVSERVGQMIEDEIEFMGPVRVSEVQGAQRTIIDVIHELAANEEIAIGKDRDGFVNTKGNE